MYLKWTTFCGYRTIKWWQGWSTPCWSMGTSTWATVVGLWSPLSLTDATGLFHSTSAIPHIWSVVQKDPVPAAAHKCSVEKSGICCSTQVQCVATIPCRLQHTSAVWCNNSMSAAAHNCSVMQQFHVGCSTQVQCDATIPCWLQLAGAVQKVHYQLQHMIIV